MNENEQVYDEQIKPLMAKIITICKEHKIPVFASFEYSEGKFCTTAIAPTEFGGHGVFCHYNVISRCIEVEGVNIDKYLMWVIRKAKEYGRHTSVYLSIIEHVQNER